MFSIAFAVTLAAILVGRWLAPRAALAAVAALTVGTLVVDQWFGAPLSYTGFFGYSPLAAARYYGMGNEAAALCLGAALVGVALVLDEWRAAPWTGWLRRYGVALLGAVVVVTASAPFWGANIGVAVWGTVGFVVAWALLNDRRVSWKTAVFAALLVALLIGVLAAFDLFGGGEQTHLGRSLVSAAQGGVGELWIIVARKAQTNVRVLSRTSWSWLLVDTLGLLVFLRVFFRERFSSLLAANSQFLFSIVAATVAGTLAFFTEDSGIVVTSLIALFVAMGLAWLALNEPTDGERT
jgi:hypothetical protein